MTSGKEAQEKKFYSGQTEQLNEQRIWWYQSQNGAQGDENNEEARRIEWEDLVASGSYQNMLSQMKIVPLYQYIVNYLRAFWSGEQIPADSAEGLEWLIQRVADTYAQNGMPKEQCKEAHIREVLTSEWNRSWDSFEKAASERIFELGLGLNLPVGDVEKLLQKAVKRAGFNYFDPEELFMYCVLRYQKQNRHCTLERLRKDYGEIEAERSEQLREKESGTHTADVHSRLELQMGEEDTLYEADGRMNRRLREFLADYKMDAPEERTAAVVFCELYEKLKEEQREVFQTFKDTRRGSEEYAETMLEVEYRADQEISLPKGSVFYIRQKKQGQEHTVTFCTAQEEVLPPLKTLELRIPIEGTKCETILQDKKKTPGYQKKGERFLPGKELLPFLGEELTEKEMTEEELQGEERRRAIYAATTVKYVGKAGSSARAAGELLVQCLPGTEILQGSEFVCNGYTYRTTETRTARAVKRVRIVCTTPGKPGEKIAETGSDWFMKRPVKGILELTNSKPVMMKKATESFPVELFRQFLYGDEREGNPENPEDLSIKVSALGRWFTETEITSARFSKIMRQAGGGARVPMEKNEVRRCDIITMIFLNFFMREGLGEDNFEQYMEGDAEAVYQDFQREANRVLRRCEMMPLFLDNPYERLLVSLILTDTPVDSLRNIWRAIKSGKDK